MAISILDPLAHQAASGPDRPYLVDISSQSRGAAGLTYADAWKTTGRVGTGLRALGVEPGDRVALRLANSEAFPAAYFGALYAGGVPVPTIRQYSLDELRFAVEDCGANVVVADDEDVEALAAALPAGTKIVWTHGSHGGVPGLFDLVDHGTVGPDGPSTRGGRDDAMIFYT